MVDRLEGGGPESMACQLARVTAARLYKLAQRDDAFYRGLHAEDGRLLREAAERLEGLVRLLNDARDEVAALKAESLRNRH